MDGFESAHGPDGVTAGIWLWTTEVTFEDGEEAVVLLMDTQGLFDPSAATGDSTTIFALALLLSSVTVSWKIQKPVVPSRDGGESESDREVGIRNRLRFLKRIGIGSQARGTPSSSSELTDKI